MLDGKDKRKLLANFETFRLVFAFLIGNIHSGIPIIHFKAIKFDRLTVSPVHFQTDPVVTVLGP